MQFMQLSEYQDGNVDSQSSVVVRGEVKSTIRRFEEDDLDHQFKVKVETGGSNIIERQDTQEKSGIEAKYPTPLPEERNDTVEQVNPTDPSMKQDFNAVLLVVVCELNRESLIE